MENPSDPNPQARGGDGNTFERRVGAMFLMLLLTRGFPAVFKDWHVIEVSFQTRHLGLETDDLLAVCSTEGDERKISNTGQTQLQAWSKLPRLRKNLSGVLERLQGSKDRSRQRRSGFSYAAGKRHAERS